MERMSGTYYGEKEKVAKKYITYSIFDRKQQNSVKQLSFNKRINFKKHIVSSVYNKHLIVLFLLYNLKYFIVFHQQYTNSLHFYISPNL